MRRTQSTQLGVWAAGLSLAAGLLHLVVAPEHLQEWWGNGYFFLAAGIGQVRYAQLLFREPVRRHRFYMLGLIATLASIALYLVKRTIGVPLFGPEAGEVEAVGAIDIPTKLVELALAGMLATLLHTTSTARRVSHGPLPSEPGAMGSPRS